MPRTITFFGCLLSSFLLILAYPSADEGRFAWVALLPFLFAIEGKTVRKKFWLGFLTGFLFFFGSIVWLRHVTWAGLLLLSLYLALYVGGFAIWTGVCLKRFPLLFQAPLLAAGWVVLEFARSSVLSGFGWNLLGYSQWRWLRLIQIADLTGAYGVSFLVVLGNAGLFLSKRFLTERKIRFLWPLGFAFFLVLLSCLYGSWRLAEEASVQTVKLGLVQGNIPQSLKWDPTVQELILTKYERLTQRLSLNEPHLIFWPETAVPGIFPRDKELLDRVQALAREGKDFLLVGSAYFSEEGITNSAVLITPKGEIEERYDKLHLVPFGEYIPLERQFPFLRDWITTGEFIEGDEVTVFHHPQGDFSVLICFEDTFPDLASRFVQRGARYLVNITNDAWFKKSAAPYQHTQASLFRAVENRVPVVRVANTGLSCLIDDRGRLLGTIADEAGIEIEVTGARTFLLPLKPPHEPSFYTRHGDLFAKSALVFVLTALVVAGWRQSQRF